MWLNSKNSFKIIEEIQRQNTDELNFQLLRYYSTKRSREKNRKELEKIELQIRSEMSANISTGKPLRHSSRLVFDGILTTKQLLPDRGQDLRTKGLCEVLCGIGETDYTTLKRMFSNEKVLILIPAKELAGSVSRIKEHADRILYLSPSLESYSYEYIRNICGHEVAHLLLHRDFSAKKSINLQEAEADLQAVAWGF